MSALDDILDVGSDLATRGMYGVVAAAEELGGINDKARASRASIARDREKGIKRPGYGTGCNACCFGAETVGSKCSNCGVKLY